MSAILETRGVRISFGGFIALDGIDLAIAASGLTAIIGPNGAGKSTFFNILSGSLAPTSGQVIYSGRDITGMPQHRFAKLGIAKSYQISSIFPQLTILENVRLAVQAVRPNADFWSPRSARGSDEAKARLTLERVGLHERTNRLAAEVSHGEQRALEIAIALAAEPRVLLLDEPTAGMSPEETATMTVLIRRLADERTVVLVEHKMKVIMSISDDVIVFHHGKILAHGTPDEVRRDDEVRRVYLGRSAPVPQ
ncbi:MAG: ABC transporter ATP-binding protein [Candidatus Velthaea sp.]